MLLVDVTVVMTAGCTQVAAVLGHLAMVLPRPAHGFRGAVQCATVLALCDKPARDHSLGQDTHVKVMELTGDHTSWP